jgi:hypothetical protein
MEVRQLVDNDYDKLCQWWSDWRWVPISRDFLPENGTGGLMVTKDGVDICAGFVYMTNSKVAWIEFVVSNFHYRESDRKSALEFLIHSLTDICKQNGLLYAFSTLKNESLIKMYEGCGFQKGSTRTTEMVKIL